MDDNLKILIKQCQENRTSAQAEMYKKFSAQLFSVCLRYADNYDDAQDIFQDGFIMIFHKINQFRFEGSFEGWLRRIMVNCCIEKHRNKNYLYVINEEMTPGESPDEEDDFESEEYSYDEILEFIRSLPDRYNQVFNLYAIEGYSHQQISEMLQISVGTSKSNLSRAREKLKELIKKNKEIKVMSK